MDENQNKHRLNVADIITFFRIAGTIPLAVLKPLSAEFFCLYALTGLTDVLDGFIARKTKTAGDFGARLDSIADLLFYTVILIRILPILLTKLPHGIWYAVAAVLCIRVSAYVTAAVKYRRFASVHTYLNKFTGFAVFFNSFFSYYKLRCNILLDCICDCGGFVFRRTGYSHSQSSLLLKCKINIL